MPDDLLPKFGKMNLGTAYVHKCHETMKIYAAFYSEEDKVENKELKLKDSPICSDEVF